MARKQKKSVFRGKTRADAERQQKEASSFGYLQLPKGVSIFNATAGGRALLDIIPYTVTDENHPDRDEGLEIAVVGGLWYKRPFKTHRNIGVKNDSVVCPTSINKRCPICEYRAQRIKEGADKDDTDALRASKRNLYAVIPLNDKKHEEKIHIWDISQWCFQNLLNDELGEQEDNDIFPDLEEGKSLRIRFSEESVGSNTFPKASRIDFEERDQAYDESILEDVPNLDELLEIHPYKKLEAIFLYDETDDDDDEAGMEIDEGDGGSIDEEKPPRKPKPKPRPSKPEPDDDNDEPTDDDDGADEEPPEEKPRPRQQRGRRERPSKKDKDERCPHGHVFGKDTDDYDECDTCDEWSDCIDVKEGAADE
jgi:hypothetical protein